MDSTLNKLRTLNLFARSTARVESAIERSEETVLLGQTPEDSSHEDVLAHTSRTRSSNSASLSSRSSANIDVGSHFRLRDGQVPRNSGLTYLRMAYRRCQAGIALFTKSGFKTDMVICVGVLSAGASFIIVLLYVFIFIWQPKSVYKLTSHNFISERPITKDGKAVNGLNRWTEDFSRSVIPIMCHSHNDYWRPYPLFSALAAGCTGVEADVWLTEDGTDLLVGHNPAELSPDRTLKSMYLDPIFQILDRENPEEQWTNHTVYDRARGVFEIQPNTTLTLLIDVKTDPQKTWKLVESQLEPLRSRQFLSRYEVVPTPAGPCEEQDMWPGPLTVVATGNMDRNAYLEYARSRDHVSTSGPVRQSYTMHLQYHDYFYDAPLDLLVQGNTFTHGISENGHPWTRSRQMFHNIDASYASVSFKKAIGSVRMGFSSWQLATLREQIKMAEMSGLKARYWDLPAWPIGYRDYVWDVLTKEGVGMLSVDDLESAARRGWSKGYIRSVVWMTVVSVWIVCVSIAMLTMAYKLLRRRADWLMRQENVISLE